jgi:hypothetical protein
MRLPLEPNFDDVGAFSIGGRVATAIMRYPAGGHVVETLRASAGRPGACEDRGVRCGDAPKLRVNSNSC